MLVEVLPKLQQSSIVLASASPRRAELLRQIGLRHFKVVVSDFEENLPHTQFRNGADYAIATARHKATASARKALDDGLRADIIIAADTVVEHKGQFLEKAGNTEEAIAMLSSLSGSQHHVHTGVALLMPNKIPQGEPFGKAGSYGIQQMAGSFVRRIDGCYFNVVGLPIHALSRVLRNMVVDGIL